MSKRRSPLLSYLADLVFGNRSAKPVTRRNALRRRTFECLEDRIALANPGDTLTWAPQSGQIYWDGPIQNWVDKDGNPSEWVSGCIAKFESTASVKAIEITGTVQVAGMKFESGSYSISQGSIAIYSSSTPMTIEAVDTDSAANNVVVNHTISSQIINPSGETGSIQKLGNGGVTLTNTSIYTFTGGTTLTGGGLAFAPGALGSGAITIDAGATGSAALLLTSTTAYTNSLVLTSGTTRLDSQANDVTWSGLIDGAGDLVISDTQGNGSVTLSNANNDQEGETRINSGTLICGTTAALGDSALVHREDARGAKPSLGALRAFAVESSRFETVRLAA